MIKCEVCNSNDIIKDNGLFVCQDCGAKYTLDEIKNSTNINDKKKNSRLNNLLNNAIVLYNDLKFDESYNLFSEVLNIDVKNHIAVFYKGLCSAWRTSIANNYLMDAVNGCERSSKFAKEKLGETKEYGIFVKECFDKIEVFINQIVHLYLDYYTSSVNIYKNEIDELKKASDEYGYYAPHRTIINLANKSEESFNESKKTFEIGTGLALTTYARMIKCFLTIINNKNIIPIETYSKIIKYSKSLLEETMDVVDKDSQLIVASVIVVCEENIKSIKKSRIENNN